MMLETSSFTRRGKEEDDQHIIEDSTRIRFEKPHIQFQQRTTTTTTGRKGHWPRTNWSLSQDLPDLVR